MPLTDHLAGTQDGQHLAGAEVEQCFLIKWCQLGTWLVQWWVSIPVKLSIVWRCDGRWMTATVRAVDSESYSWSACGKEGQDKDCQDIFQ